MVATPIQSSAPTFSLATLRTVLAKGQAAHPDLACRMDRAAHIVAFRRIEAALAPENAAICYWVQSECSEREYWVSLSERGYQGDTCTCPDYQRRGGPCKHAIACRLLQACERREAPQVDNIIRLPVPTLDLDAPIPFELTPKAFAALDADPSPVA